MRLRPNVALLIVNPQGAVLLGERADFPGFWQFPQGGIKPGESAPQAALREAREETSLPPRALQIVCSFGPYRYLLPPELQKKGWSGQEQTYFLMRLNTPAFHGEPTPREEFRRLLWLPPAEYQLRWAPPFKREVYRCVFDEIFGLLLPPCEKSR